MENSPAALRLTEVTQEYPARGALLAAAKGRRERVRALDAVSLTIRAGEIVALVGQNGAGKSTLLRLCAALLTPTRGRVEIGGVASTDKSPARMKVGFADGTGLSPRLSARENLRLAAALYGLDAVAADRIRETATRLAIEGLLDARVQTLSHGEQSRVVLARALLHRPGLLLVDELFTALDPGAAFRLRGHLTDLALRDQVTAVVATHDLALARSLGRCVVLDKGHVVGDGAFSEVASALQGIFGIPSA